MKLIKLIKSIPFLITLIFLVIISISNQKENTKLKILIWNTPSLTLGTYITISTGTGYLLSYIITNNFINSHFSKKKNVIQYKPEKQKDEINTYNESIEEIKYDNAWIERDVKDPSPTMKASFRVIGKNNRRYNSETNSEINNIHNDYGASDYSDESDYNYYKNEINSQNDNESNSVLNDWENESYLNW